MDAELLRGLIQELCAIPEVVVNPDYDALRRRADAALSVAQGQGFVMAPRVPANCRQRLAHEGKPYPRSSCAACGKFSPNYRQCEAVLAGINPAAPAQPDGVSK